MRTALLSSILVFTILNHSHARTEYLTNVSDSTGTRVFDIPSIRIAGEVEDTVLVDLSHLPLRSVRIKEVMLDDSGHQQFKGAFLCTGYSLYDILSTVKVKKLSQREFSPSTDLYVIVENDHGHRTVFSWGEIFYAKDNYGQLISKSVTPINPSKLKATWPLPEQSRLVCTHDLSNCRFLSTPSRIVVRSFAGSFQKEKPKDIYSPEISVINGAQSFCIREVASNVETRTYNSVGYGHGMGYKGVQNVTGNLLKIALVGLKKNANDSRNSILVVSAKDGYRAVFSLSEIFNRNDNQDFLLVDQKDSKNDGRFSIFVAPDFFVDRNVKAIEKIELAKID